MPTYIELKSSKYFDKIVSLAGQLLGVSFQVSGGFKCSAFCPFHKDTKDSFRVYVSQKDEVRFRCFGACNTEWDIYDIIQKKFGCSFREAQHQLALYLKEDIQIAAGDSSAIDTPPGEAESGIDDEPPISFNEPVELGPEIFDALATAADFYHQFLADQVQGRAVDYLYRRGLDDKLIARYRIGYAPPYKDPDHTGTALLDAYLPRFQENYHHFSAFFRAGLFRVLTDETVKGYGYYRQFANFSKGIHGNYGDYFAGRITFPVFDIRGRVCGFVGRKPDNRGIKWMKQQTSDTHLNPKSWLYGIDKAIRQIARYRTVILVEGIFDYFAFLRIHQDQDKPLVVSTLGARLTEDALALFKSLNVKNFIVAYDWDDAGKKAIWSIAGQIGEGCHISYLGGMPEGKDPADHLANAVNAIDGFSLAHLLAGAEKAQALTDKPVHIDIITTGKRQERSVVFSPITTASVSVPTPAVVMPREYVYSADELLGMLTYDHTNKTLLEGKLDALTGILESRPQQKDSERVFRLPSNFIEEKRYTALGPAIILWLKIAIEQQQRKRRLKATDSTLAQELKTSRATISKYKGWLKEAGYLNVVPEGKVQKLSVRYFVKTRNYTTQ